MRVEAARAAGVRRQKLCFGELQPIDDLVFGMKFCILHQFVKKAVWEFNTRVRYLYTHNWEPPIIKLCV